MCLFAAIIQLKVSRVPSLLLLSILYLNKHCPGPGRTFLNCVLINKSVTLGTEYGDPPTLFTQ